MILNDKLGPDGDALYTTLMQAHEGLSTEQSHALNARLVLMMMNEIANPEKLATLIKEARSISPG